MEKTKPRVLIVDDNPVCREQAGAIAKKFCDCVTVSSGEEAVKAFLETFQDEGVKFDAIFLDFEMPEMNGLDVLTEIRKSEKKRKLPKEDQVKIIMTTATNDRQVVNACKSMGCNHYIIKPLSNENLQEKLKFFKLL